MPDVKPTPDDDELDELPPIDGDGGDDEQPSGEEDLEDDEPPDDGVSPLDDSTGEGDPIDDIEVSGAESGWLDDAGESDALDVGTPATFGEEDESLLDGGEEAEGGEEELPFDGGDEGSTFVGDAGEEGFADEEEDLREEDLPRLDADEDGTESDDTELGEGLGLLEEDGMDEPRPAWDDRAWERLEGGPAGLAAVDAVACPSEALLVCGQGLARVERGGKVTALEGLGLRGGAARSIASEGERILVSTPRAGLLVSRDAGRSFVEANGWRTVAGERGEGALDVVVLGGDLWGRTPSGALVWSADGGSTWARVQPERRFEAIAGDSSTGQIVALAREAAASLVARGVAGGLTVMPAGELPAGPITAFVAHGRELGVRVGSRGVFRAVDGAWERIEGSAAATALAYVRGDGTLALALHGESEARSWLLEAKPGCPARTVAELGGPGWSADEDAAAAWASEDGDGYDTRVRALAWDASAGLVWVAGAFGLCGFRPSRDIRPRAG